MAERLVALSGANVRGGVPAGGRAVRALPAIAGVTVIVLGSLVLAGWVLGSELLTSVGPGLPSMKANAAVAIVCAGVAVLCLRPGTRGSTHRIGRLLALLVAAFGIVVAAEYLIGGFGIDQALFHDAVSVSASPGRPSPHTALAMIALGAALATLDAGGRWRRVHFAILAITATVVLFGVVGYVYGVDYLRGASGVSGMGLNTLLALVLLTVAVACLPAEHGAAVWLQRHDSGARMARVLLPVAVVAPLLLGGVRFEAQQLGWIGLRVGLSTYTLSMIFILAILVALLARRLSRSDLDLRRLAAIADASDDAMINKTIDGVILSWNGAAERMYGYSASEVVGRGMSILAPAEHPDEIAGLLERVSSGEVVRVETERVRRDGTRLNVALTISPIRDETGRVVGASTTARDITERREAERRLERLARLLADAQTIAGLGSWESDVQDGSSTWSDQVYKIFGVDRERFVSGDASVFRELLHPDDRDRYLATLTAVKETGTSADVVFRIRRPDGEERILETWARLASHEGRARVVGTVMDITETRRLQEQLTAARDLFAGVLDAATETSIVGTDPGGLITVFNRGAERMLGRRAEEMIGRHTPACFHDAAEIAARAAELGIEPGFEVFAHDARAGGSETREWSYLHADGHRLRVSLTSTAVRGELGEVKGFIGVARDVTEVREAEAARRQAEQRFEAAFEHAPIGVAITGIRGADRGRWIHTNEAFARLVGREPGELDGMAVTSITHPDDLEATAAGYDRLDNNETIRYEKRYLHRDGQTVSVLISATPILDETDGRPLYSVSQVVDISERKRFEGQLRHLADHDALTGLYNRPRFESELDRIIEESRRYGRSFALLVLDLDGFKSVNDRFGHLVGDELLTRIGGLLGEAVRHTDIIARLGGDEFAVILHEADEAGAVAVADKILDAIRRGGVVRNGIHQARVTTSIGITTVDGDCRLTGEELVVEADIAMYDAKSDGRNRSSVHDRVAIRREVTSKDHSWLERLRHAIDEELFVLYAQPIVGISLDGVPYYELLLRMPDDHGDLIPSAAFIPSAERFGLAGSIDRWVLGEAVKMLHDYTAAGHDLSFAVRLSDKVLDDLAIADDLAAMVAEHPISDGRLVVEITETAAAANIERARDLAGQLRKLGCRCALDCFGAGFGSFYFLEQLDLDYLKIDGHLIAKLTDTRTDQLVVKAIVDIAHGLGTKTVAEFVGDDATLELLRSLGVDYCQGDHLGRPGPISERLPDLRMHLSPADAARKTLA